MPHLAGALHACGSRVIDVDDEVRTSVNPRVSYGTDVAVAKIQQHATTAAKNSSTQRSAELQQEARNLEYRDRRIPDKLGSTSYQGVLRGPQRGHKSATASGRHATGHHKWRRPPSEEEEWMEEALEQDLELVRAASFEQPALPPPAAFTLADFM